MAQAPVAWRIAAQAQPQLLVQLEAQLAAASEARSEELQSTGLAGSAPRAKVESLARMLREQQEELSEGYRFSATSKLVAALDNRRRVSLAVAVGSWRCVCA